MKSVQQVSIIRITELPVPEVRVTFRQGSFIAVSKDTVSQWILKIETLLKYAKRILFKQISDFNNVKNDLHSMFKILLNQYFDMNTPYNWV